ncbi:hypothetical protein ASE75_01840 [Sphingomonas sp. Leaf17]|nr:hypothetical protein ASE75_01840 [Sphingomonas sp. Leaf17]
MTLRPAWPEDADRLAAMIQHEAVAGMLARAPFPCDVADARAFITAPRGVHDIAWLVFTHDGGYPAMIGGIGLWASGDAHEIGYWITPHAWGRGYATEAARAVIETARDALPVHRIIARHRADNPASARVLHKLGFRATGRTESFASVAQPAPVDTALLELTLRDEDQTPSMPLAA